MMLTIQQLESVCKSPQPALLLKHPLEPPELPFEETFYPFGFPATVRSNSDCVLERYREMWGQFSKQHNTDPIRVDAQLVKESSEECPPEPKYWIMMPLFTCVADPDNVCTVDLDHCHAKIVVSRGAIQHRLYAHHYLLGTPVCCVATTHATPIHAGCVALEGRGVLLCGDSGAGKSTLSYACARAGWTYVSDDATYLLNGGSERMMTGNCHQVRFRPSAAELFPEIAGLEITPRVVGKPSIEMPTAMMPHITCTQTTRVDFIVFLNRHAGEQQQLIPFRKDVARQFMRQVLYGSAITRAVQYAAIERLLAIDVLELRYTHLEWAIHRLQTLVEKGH
jgi:hypothetical protein